MNEKKDILLCSAIIVMASIIVFTQLITCMASLTINFLTLAIIVIGLLLVIIIASIIFAAEWHDLFKE